MTSCIPETAAKPDCLADLLSLPSDRFDNRFVRELPADPLPINTPRQVPGVCYTLVAPTPVRAPRLLAWVDPVGELLGLSRPTSPDGAVAEVLAGSRVLPGMQPYAARYGGHQFGQWAGQLGDGRAITLTEILNPQGERFELQLKGAGRTPYSRRADGRAVLRSSLREFVASEAMQALGVPTTRALSLAGTGEVVMRDMFYDGHPRAEPGAVVCRVAPSFVRFGNFEIHAAQGETETLKRLADHVVTTHFPALLPKIGPPSAQTYARWFEEICRRTARLVVDWMRVGFVHGVMNTDNMSILGLTIDYGPYGWLEGYDPTWTPNTTDADSRRYCYGRQPQIALWNLERLADALAPLIGTTGGEDGSNVAALEQGLAAFADDFTTGWRRMFAAKLGWRDLERPGDDALVGELFGLLDQVETDMTLLFRGLADVPLAEGSDVPEQALIEPLRRAFYAEEEMTPSQRADWYAWLRRYTARARLDGESDGAAAARRARMNCVNPKYVPRNYLAQQAIDALEQGDAAPLERLMAVLQHPYDEQPAENELAARRPEWARHKAGCSALSCSS
jgi:serine/tyrosine/threonine adenylyltransferase